MAQRSSCTMVHIVTIQCDMPMLALQLASNFPLIWMQVLVSNRSFDSLLNAVAFDSSYRLRSFALCFFVEKTISTLKRKETGGEEKKLEMNISF